MGALDSFIASGLSFISDASVGGESFTFRGATYIGLITELGSSAEWMQGGDKLIRRCTVLFAIPTVDFTNPEIKKGDSITVRGKAMKVDGIDKDATSYTLQCVDARA